MQYSGVVSRLVQVPPDERARLPVHGQIMCALAVLGDAEALITLWTSPAVRSTACGPPSQRTYSGTRA